MLCAYSIRRKAKKVLKLVLSRLIVEHHENFIWSFISIQDRMQWAKKPSHATVPFRDNKARLKLLRFFIFTGEIESCNLLFWRETVFLIIVTKSERNILERKLVDIQTECQIYCFITLFVCKYKYTMITPSFLFACMHLFIIWLLFFSIFLDTWAHGLSPSSQETTLGRDRTKLTTE